MPVSVYSEGSMSTGPRKKFDFFNGGRGIDVSERHDAGDGQRVYHEGDHLRQHDYTQPQYHNTYHNYHTNHLHHNNAYSHYEDSHLQHHSYSHHQHHHEGNYHTINRTQHLQTDPIRGREVDNSLRREVNPLQLHTEQHHEVNSLHRHEVRPLHRHEVNLVQHHDVEPLQHNEADSLQHNEADSLQHHQISPFQHHEINPLRRRGIEHHQREIEHQQPHFKHHQQEVVGQQHHREQGASHATEPPAASPSPDSPSPDSPSQNNTSPHNSEQINTKRRQRCRLCANHNIDVDIKGHKWLCRFRRDDHKNCMKCQVTKERQYYMAKQQKMTREQNQSQDMQCTVMDLAHRKEYPRMKELIQETSNLIDRGLFTEIEKLIRLRKGE